MAKAKDIQLAAEAIPFIVADIYHLTGLFRRWGDTIAAKVGQTQARWQVLSAASDGKQTVAQLARRLGVSRQNVQRIADLLAGDGLVEYVYNRNHERSPHVRLTPEGSKSLATLTKAATTYHAELAEGLRVEDVTTARIVLAKMRSQLQRDLMAE